MPILLDGNNLLYDLPQRDRCREDVRRMVLDRVRHERQRVIVVFDGPPPTGSPPRESLGSVTVVWAGARSADDVIIATLPESAPARQWVVVTDDRGLARQARARGAEIRRLAEWRNRSPTRDDTPDRAPDPPHPGDLMSWESYFRSRREDDDRPRRVARRRRRRSGRSDDL